MRFYTQQRPFYSGINLHAWTIHVCAVNQDGEVLLYHNMKTAPEPFLKAMTPYHDGLVVAVECMFTGYWLANLWTQEGMAFVLGHALSMKAIHSGRAKNDQIASHQMAALRRGDMIPQAYVYPAPRRATRDLARYRQDSQPRTTLRNSRH